MLRYETALDSGLQSNVARYGNMPIAPALLLATSTTNQVVRALFDDTFAGVHHLELFDWSLLIPYFVILVILSCYGCHRFEMIRRYLKHRSKLTPQPAARFEQLPRVTVQLPLYNERFVVESVHSRAGNEIGAVVSTSRLHNIAGTYTGKDDPVALVRTQGNFPATGEILSPFRIGHYVAGTMRGSHNGPLMPVKLNSTISFFDGPAVVSGAAFCVHEGKFTECVDVFDHPFWDWVRNNVAAKAAEIRNQGFSGPAMLPYTELEYGGVVEKMGELDTRFIVRKDEHAAAAAGNGGRKKKAA